MKKIQVVNKDDNKLVIKSDSKIGRSIFLSLLKNRDLLEEDNIKMADQFKFRAPLFVSVDVQNQDGSNERFLCGPNIFLHVEKLNLYKIDKVKKNLEQEIDIDFEVSKCCITKVDDCIVNIVQHIFIPNDKLLRMQICASEKGPIDCTYNTKTDDYYFMLRWKY